MKVCEFLLQKEGDRVWLPLEPPTVEILEGRYRIVARTQHPQMEVFVEVSYWSPEDMPPKRRTRHWNRRTNAKGIMPVLPFTALRSGNWRVQCSSDLLEDMGNAGWQHVVELRVLAQEADLEDWQRSPAPVTRQRDSQKGTSTIAALTTRTLEPALPQTEQTGIEPEIVTDPEIMTDPEIVFEPEIVVESEIDTIASPGDMTLDREPDVDDAEVQVEPPAASPRRAGVEELRSLAEQMAHLVLDTVMDVGEQDPLPSSTSSPEEAETSDFFTVTDLPELSTLESESFDPDNLALELPPVVTDTLSSAEPIASPTIATIPEPASPERSPALDPAELTLPPGIQLQLKTNTIVPSPYSLFELYGYILTANGEPLRESPLPLQARVMLKNPGNMEVRLAMTHLLATQPIDQPFYLSGHIALDWRNQLLLGEVQLQSLSLSVEDLTEDVITIATAPFTLMPSVDALLTQVNPPELDTGSEEAAEPTPSPDVAPPRKQIRADFLEVTRRTLSSPVSTPAVAETGAESSPATPAAKVEMPPSLKSTTAPSREVVRSEPNLPSFVHPASNLPADLTGDLDPGRSDLSVDAPLIPTDSTDSTDSTAPTDLQEPSAPSELMTAQLTLLNLADWTDPTVPLDESSEPESPEESIPPRRSIQLPPVPTRSQSPSSLSEVELDKDWGEPALGETEAHLETAEAEEDVLIPDPLAPELSPSELAAFELTDAELVAASSPGFSPEEAIVDFAMQPHTFEADAGAPVPSAAEPVDYLETDSDPDHQGVVSLNSEEENWLPSVLTNVLDSDQALHLSTPDHAPRPGISEDTLSPPEVEPPADPLVLDFLGDSEVESVPEAEPTETSLGNEPLLTWEDKPTESAKPEPLRDFSAGEFFSHEDRTSANVSPPDPILDSFFTEGLSDQGFSQDRTALPEVLDFAENVESFDQVQIPPHLELSEVDLSDSELWELESSPASPAQDPRQETPQRQSEPFVLEHLRQEIVVDDEWLEPDTRHWMSSTSPVIVVTWPEEEPLPLPSLELPTQDLRGGESIRVTVRLPETSSRLAVKLWLIDCQTRSLAAGPFWAYQFLPTLPQFQEAIVDIAVPLGCLEVQFEALTIEAETQRESHKFTVVRTIVPSEFQEPDENLLAPDNFLDYLPPSLESLEDDRLED